MTLRSHYDVVVLGAGFAGSLMAAIAARQGLSTLLLERGRHPRFAIGESSTPLANLLLEEIASTYDLPALMPLTKWGSWQKHRPKLACGLKRGFTFFHHELEQPAETWREELLVAASPHDAVGDTHWYREHFDQALLQIARDAGVEYRDNARVEAARESATAMEIEVDGVPISAGLLLDATGPRGCLHRLLHLQEASFAQYPSTQSIYTHFRGVERLPIRNDAPYPQEDAAVHHVFDGAWAWVLHFNNGVTSAGVAATQRVAERFHFADAAGAWQRLLEHVPALQRQFRNAVATRPFVPVPQLSFRSATVAGRRWALLPSAAGFVDPLLSTGFPLTLLGVARLAKLLRSHEPERALAQYAEATDAELQQTALLIRALYANMRTPKVFRALSMMYFAAASYSETVRRLGKPELADSFLLCGKQGVAFSRLFAAAGDGISADDADSFVQRVQAALEPIDVGGFTQQKKHYRCSADDLFHAAPRLGVSREEIAAMLRKVGFAG